MITILAQTFTDITEAFEYFIKEIYPNLSSEEKRVLKSAKHDFTTKRVAFSEERMEGILKKYANAEVKKIVIFS